MPKRPASPSSTAANNPNALHKSPIFWILTGLSAILLLTLPIMYVQLETINKDDDLVMLGSSGGDGMRNDAFELRRQQRAHQQQQQQRHRQRRREGGGMLGMGGGGHSSSMVEGIRQFESWKAHEAQKREKRGILTTREEFEHDNGGYPDNLREVVAQKLRLANRPSPPDVPYDIYHCPDEPPPGYPFTWNSLKVLGHWNPDDTQLPEHIHHSLCVFDWEEDQDKAYTYREQQVPFILQNVPEVMKASLRWTSEGYLNDMLQDEPIRNEHSRNNHFMYWKTRHPIPNYQPPTDMVDLTYQQWYEHARHLEETTSEQKQHHKDGKENQVDQEHWYFRLNAMFDKHGVVYEELPFFDPSLGESMTMIDPEQHRGINCRFGMRGVIAETHFDSSTNFIALMGGQRRYILAHPDQCPNMELYPQQHPSGRHSSINWSTAAQDFVMNDPNRPFANAQVNEVVLQAGDMLYLPTFWFHFIVSLNLNFQCNSRSGEFYDYEHYISDCGFASPKRRKGG